jgi:hypothetical protein
MPYAKGTDSQPTIVTQPEFITVSNSDIYHVHMRIKTETLLSIALKDCDDGTVRLRSTGHRWGKLNVN